MTENNSTENLDTTVTQTVPIQNAYSTRVGTLKGTRAEHIQHLGQGPLESVYTIEQSSKESE
jgi:hypothetical protein